MTQKVGGVEFDVDVGVDGAITASKKLVSSNESLENSFRQVDATTKKTSDSMTKSAKRASSSFGGLRGAAGQLGFQVQDMAVQLQSGTNAMVVLGQQGSHVASIFGPTGAIVGGVIAVGAALAGVLVPSLMDSGDETETLTEKIKELQKESKLTADQAAFLAQQEAKQREETEKRVKELEKQIAEQEKLIATNDQEIKQAPSLAKARKGVLVSDQVKAYKQDLTAAREELVKLKAELSVEKGETGGQLFDPEANKKAIKSYAERIAAIQAAMDQESSIVINSLKYRAAVEDGIFTEQEAKLKERRENAIVNERASFANKLQMLNEQREQILENEDLTETQRQELLSQYRVMEADARYTHQQKLTDIDQQAADAREKIAAQEARAKQQAISSMFGNLSSLMNTESRGLFEIGKAAALAQAVIDGYAATVGAYKYGASLGGPALGAAFAAAAAAATFAQIKQIQSTQFGSASTGQSIQGGQVVNNQSGQQGPQQPDRNISIALTGSNFSGGAIRELIGQINEELGDGVNLGVSGG